MQHDVPAPGGPYARESDLRIARGDLTAFLMTYKFGLDEMLTKINILREEFAFTHDYNPIEHVKSRLKSPASIAEKAHRKGCGPDPQSIRRHLLDIAGVRITCSFISDVYSITAMLTGQQDVRVLRTRDYIEHPKPNGYQSLHLVLEIPVFLSDRVEPVPIEVQIRTAAMDFWAGLEHKINYKYRGEIPARLLDELRDAATVADNLDKRMERLRTEVVQQRGG
jgi:putative GTP pyrophosphokinase